MQICNMMHHTGERYKRVRSETALYLVDGPWTLCEPSQAVKTFTVSTLPSLFHIQLAAARLPKCPLRGKENFCYRINQRIKTDRKHLGNNEISWEGSYLRKTQIPWETAWSFLRSCIKPAISLGLFLHRLQNQPKSSTVYVVPTNVSEECWVQWITSGNALGAWKTLELKNERANVQNFIFILPR